MSFYKGSVIEQYKQLEGAFDEGSFPRNMWLRDENIEIYVRLSRRVFPDATGLQMCLDIANIGNRRLGDHQGFFREFIKVVESECQFNYIYFENVHNRYLEEKLIKNGYQRRSDTEERCYYKRIR